MSNLEETTRKRHQHVEWLEVALSHVTKWAEEHEKDQAAPNPPDAVEFDRIGYHIWTQEHLQACVSSHDSEMTQKHVVAAWYPCDDDTTSAHGFVFVDGVLIKELNGLGPLFFAAISAEFVPLPWDPAVPVPEMLWEAMSWYG